MNWLYKCKACGFQPRSSDRVLYFLNFFALFSFVVWTFRIRWPFKTDWKFDTLFFLLSLFTDMLNVRFLYMTRNTKLRSSKNQD